MKAAAGSRDRASARFLVAVIATAAAALPAQAQLRPGQLEQLLNEGEADRAYELALEHREELEGELLFDYYYGLAAIESGRVSEGVFALERVIGLRPAFGRARLALGRGYFLLGEYRRAETHFAAAMAQDPPAPIRDAVERYRRAIRQRSSRYSTVVSGYVEGGLGSDSNVNSATDEEVIDSVFGPLQLRPDSQEIDDEFARLAAGVRVDRPLAEDITGFAKADFEEQAYGDESDFDRRRLDGRLGATLALDRWRTTLSGRVQRFYVGSERYQDLGSVAVEAAYRFTDTTSLLAGLQVTELDNEISDNLDSRITVVSGGVSQLWKTALRPAFSLLLFAGTEDADEDTNAAESNTARDLLGFAGQLRLQFNPEWGLAAALQYRQSEYDERDVLLDATRDEDYYQLELDLIWSPDPRWRIGPRLLASENDANTDLHEYSRTVLEVSARYNFY